MARALLWARLCAKPFTGTTVSPVYRWGDQDSGRRSHRARARSRIKVSVTPESSFSVYLVTPPTFPHPTRHFGVISLLLDPRVG